MKKILLFASIAIIFASCSHKPKAELEVNIQNNSSLIDKEIVVIQKKDGVVTFSDTVKIRKDRFVLNIPYTGPALIDISIPNSNVRNVMMAAEEGKLQLNIDGTKPQIGGSPLNDRLQAFYLGNDSVSLLFQQMDKDFQALSQNGKATPQQENEYRQKRSQLLKENTDRIIAFTKENVDNPVGEYYFMTTYITFPVDRKLELNAFATQKLKQAFGIK